MPVKPKAGDPTSQVLVDHNPPVPVDYGPTISGVTGLIAVIALIFSVASYRRSGRLEKSARFESSFGSAIRLQLRTFEDDLSKLDAFIFPSAKSVDESKKEIENIRSELEVSSNKVSRLLREIDISPNVRTKNLQTGFTGKISLAETAMQAIAHPSVQTDVQFRAAAALIRDRYQECVDGVRHWLESERSKI